MPVPEKAVHFQQYEFRKWQELDSETIVETPVSLTVNGKVWLTFMCTPVDLEALAVGFLFNEGIVRQLGDVADVRVCEHGDNVDVWLNCKAEEPISWRRTSGCTGGMTAVDLLAKPNLSLRHDALTLTPEEMERLIERLFEAQVLYRKTGGVHTSILSDSRQTLVSAEDIGRHNTLDKIAGLCLMKDIESRSKVLMTTGRISSEMLQKSASLQVPIVISRTSPSSLSIEIADRYGITLIGYARRQRFSVYTHGWRVTH